jgi:hypothetical protein
MKSHKSWTKKFYNIGPKWSGACTVNIRLGWELLAATTQHHMHTMRLHHYQEGGTYPGYRRMCFVYNSQCFRGEQNALAFHWDTWCHLALCLQMMPLRSSNKSSTVNSFIVEALLHCWGKHSSLFMATTGVEENKLCSIFACDLYYKILQL